MDNLFNFQKHRWDHNSDPVLDLRQQEQDAHALLASHNEAVDASNMFVVLMSTPYVAGFLEHDRHVSKNEQLLALTFTPSSEPSSAYRLSSVTSECACADLRDLRVEKIHLSGSVREGTHVRVWSEIGSDVDAMFQLGPVTVVDAAAARRAPQARLRRSLPGVELRAEPTPNPGFVLLRHAQSKRCHHADSLLFGADRAVALLDVFRARLDANNASRREGPALSTHVADFQQHWKNTDLVPCVTASGFWPAAQFDSRQACRSGQPEPWLTRRLAELPVFLVPVGFPGSPTEHDEWRVSFSRHEYILLRDMSEAQRACLTLLKTCKAVLDLHALKSYHLKTALFWLCETRPRSQWTREGTQHSLLQIITFLEDAMRRRRLPCYFWPEMNILASRDAAQLSQMSSDLRRLKGHLLSCSLALLTHWLGGTVPDIAKRLLFTVTAVPGENSMPMQLLTETFLENLSRGRADGWGYIHGLITCALSPGALPMPFGSCFSLLFRSVVTQLRAADNPNGGLQCVSILEALLRDTPDGEDSWMVRR